MKDRGLTEAFNVACVLLLVCCCGAGVGVTSWVVVSRGMMCLKWIDRWFHVFFSDWLVQYPGNYHTYYYYPVSVGSCFKELDLGFETKQSINS